MTKSILPSFKKWTIDERRLLVILLLILIYPVFVSSFFALYVFVLMPVIVPLPNTIEEAHHEGWYHLYWLFATLLWVVLCTLVLPCFKKKSVQHMLNLTTIESSSHAQPAIKVEIKKEEGSHSNLSQKSETSSDNIKKATSDLESEKESLEKSRESLRKSPASLNRKKLTQSGEFLNDFISTIDSDVKKNETICEIHTEERQETDNDKIKDNSDQEDKELVDEQGNHQSEDSEDETIKDKVKKRTSDIKDVSTEELADKDKEGYLKKYSDNSSESSSSNEEVEPFIPEPKTKQLQTSSPLKISESVFEQHEDLGEPEMTEELDTLDNFSRPKREKGILTVDTSRTSGYYECSMPTPLSMESKSSQNNTVFLFINPESTATEDSILVSHGGQVEESAVEKTEP